MYDATLLIVGLVVFAITAGLFVYCLPRGGKMHRFVGTEFEPYVAVAFTAGGAQLHHDPQRHPRHGRVRRMPLH